MKKYRLGAVIDAAGGSGNIDTSRLMLHIKSKPAIELAIDTLKEAGISDIFVVTGSRSAGLENRFNDEIAGDPFDGMFYLPADIPAFTLFTVQQLMREMGFDVPAEVAGPFSQEHEVLSGQSSSCRQFASSAQSASYGQSASCGQSASSAQSSSCKQAGTVGKGISDEKKPAGLIPTYKGKPGYPILFGSSMIESINKCGDMRGIADILRDFKQDDRLLKYELPDPAIRMSISTSSGYEKLKDHIFSLRTPGLAYCRELLAWMNVPKDRLRHMEAVAFHAREMAEEFNSRGRDTYSLLLDENLTAAGGMLHDIAKGYPKHDIVGGAMLRALGMPRVAEIVENHKTLGEKYFEATSPVLIVYLADKMYCGSEPVGIEERFRRKEEKRKGDAKALAVLKRKKEQALRAQKVYENSILGWPVG